MRKRKFKAGSVAMGAGSPLFLIAGPCVIESRKGCLDLARRLAELAERESIPLVFKASYDKANRTSLGSFRGPGLDEGLDILAEVKARYGLPLLTDIHQVSEVAPAAKVVDILQIPAFLCRQTDLVVEAGRSGAVVNVKKGQFMAPWDIGNVIAKIESAGNRKILLTERGVSFGYNNLVADMRSILVMKETGYPVVFDATHSVQLPGGAGTESGGDAKWAPFLARAAAAAGCDGLFLETHVRPEKALSDRSNAVPCSALPAIWRTLKAISDVVGEAR